MEGLKPFDLYVFYIQTSMDTVYLNVVPFHNAGSVVVVVVMADRYYVRPGPRWPYADGFTIMRVGQYGDLVLYLETGMTVPFNLQ